MYKSYLNAVLFLFLQKAVATYFLNNPVDIAAAYQGRATVDVDIINQVSTLRLTKVTMQDNRRYQCSVMISSEGTTSATTSLVVLGESHRVRTNQQLYVRWWIWNYSPLIKLLQLFMFNY